MGAIVIELLLAVRCPACDRTLLHASPYGEGVVRQRCPRCSRLWRYAMRTGELTREANEHATDTYHVERELTLAG